MGNDLSFNIVALDKASATFIKMAEQVDRLAARLDKLDGNDVTVDVNIKTDKSDAALGLLDTRFKKLAAGIVAGSAFLGPAILAGVGTGFVGVAALASKSNKDVQETYKTLWQNVVATTHNATDQLTPQIVGAGRAMDAQFQKLGPDIKRAFSFAGPDIVALTSGVNNLASNVMPGLTASMQQSLPVAESVSIVMGTMGTAVGDTLTTLSQHSAAFGVDVQSLGSITKSALGAATTVVSDLGMAWAQNAGSINSAVSGVSGSISGLANGVLPVLSSGLGAVASVVSVVAHALEPLAPILGFIGAAALATWAGFKLAGLATVGVRALAMGVVSLGGSMEAGAAKSAVMVAGLRGVSAEASRTAVVVNAAGAATATAAVRFGVAAEAMAGPLGIALIAGTALWGLFANSEDTAAESAQNLKAATDAITSAFEASHGAVDTSVVNALQSSDAYKNTADAAAKFGITQAELTKAILTGGAALDAIREKLSKYKLHYQGQENDAQKLQHQVDGLVGSYTEGKDAAADYAREQGNVARQVLATSDVQGTAATTAKSLGLSLGEVTAGFFGVVAGGAAASTSAQDVAVAFVASELTIMTATRAIQDHFVNADKAVVQAQASVESASHSVAQSSRQVADARHSEAAAQRALTDAYAGVTQAEQSYVRAQEQERKAQGALSVARQQAVEDLKALHLQLADQVVSEQQARVRLFDANTTAKDFGITPDNAQKIASQTVTADNEDQIKQALDLIGAQNALNDALNSGTKLRKDVTAADKAGVDGSAGVLSAQDSLRSAHDQVVSAEAGLLKAHQQVTDASYSLTKAHQAVRDAQYQQARSSDQLRIAQTNLKDAQDAASRTLDINTKAGQENLSLLFALWDAINKTGLPTQGKYQSMVDGTAKAFGVSKQAAADLLTQMGLIPKDFKYNVTAVAGVDFADAAAILGQARTITGITRHAEGGPIGGIGGPRDDLNLIWASAGEYMQPADVVSHYGLPVMRAMHDKRLRIMGGDGVALPGYAGGGLIGALDAFTTLATYGTTYQANVNALQVAGLPRPPGLPKYDPGAFPMFGPPGPGVVPGFIPRAGVAQWAPQILQALSMLGQPATWLSVVERRMNQESGGNPTVVNKWDSNWTRGTPSVGLMQVIGPTFAHNAGPFAGTGPFSYGVSVDPLANIYAGLNYAIHRYGSLSALNRPGGYDNGGAVQPGWTSVFNGTGRPENVRSAVAEDKILTAVQNSRKESHYHLNAYVTNQTMDVEAQFRRMELLQP